MSFNRATAAKQLEVVARRLYKDQEEGEVCEMKNVGKMIDLLTFETADKKGSSILCVQEREGDQSKELMARVVGVLVGHDLPPRRRPVPPRERMYARQHAMLSGLGAPVFKEAVDGLVELTQQFGSFFEPGEWTGWTPPTTHDGFLALEANCRYFTPVRHTIGGVDIPFQKTVDPQQHLERSKDVNFIHTGNNVVEFYQANADKEGYDAFDPKGFRDGDVVAAHVGFMAVKSKGPPRDQRNNTREPDRCQLLVILRGLTLLARNEQHVPHLAGDPSRSSPTFTNPPRRKRIYNILRSEQGMEGVEDNGVAASFKHLKVTADEG